VVVNQRLVGKTAVVTGAASGIGRAIAHRLGAEGALVIVADINPAGAEETTAAVIAAGGRAESLQVDVGEVERLEGVFEDVARRHGLDVLVNNAGISGRADLLTVEPAEWDRITGVNLRGAFFCLQAATRQMIPRGGGRIVNTASISAKGYRRTVSIPYAAAKAGLVVITRLAAVRLAEHGITVNAVCPGPTRTPMNMGAAERIAAESGLSFEEAYARYAEHIPLRRPNDPEDIAAAIAFLASDDARNITGQSLNVDGGLIFD
jgi:NAD(P)-dependent dehydrogenase (short-subunit alcohol dehydrogenase family)